MLKCNGKTFMNLQEAVQWLLNNNALVFISTGNYAADTEIPLSDLVNPSPANPKIGSVVMFADGKISPITGLTDDSFTVGSDYIEPQVADIPLLETIVDKDGHNRFVEGNLEIPEIAGVTQEYGKWSLSGTHLMIVVAFKVDNATTLTWGSMTIPVNIPSWIFDKVKVLTPQMDKVSQVIEDVPNADGSTTQTFSMLLRKTSYLFINNETLVATDDRYVRIQFDLLIDDE